MEIEKMIESVGTGNVIAEIYENKRTKEQSVTLRKIIEEPEDDRQFMTLGRGDLPLLMSVVVYVHRSMRSPKADGSRNESDLALAKKLLHKARLISIGMREHNSGVSDKRLFEIEDLITVVQGLLINGRFIAV